MAGSEAGRKQAKPGKNGESGRAERDSGWRCAVISLFLWLLRIPVPVLILLYLFNII
ncbi:MAG: hypothetical protein ABSC26_03840 [Stellaceae bacterium]|jgi:hypothetical protein